jgi:hypothetical protein
MTGLRCEPGMVETERMADEQAGIELRRVEAGFAKLPCQLPARPVDRARRVDRHGDVLSAASSPA